MNLPMQERWVLLPVHWSMQYHWADHWLWGGGGKRQPAGRQINGTSQCHNKGHRADDSTVVFQLPEQAEGVCGGVEDAQVWGLQTVTGVAVMLQLFWRESYCLHWQRQGECTSMLWRWSRITFCSRPPLTWKLTWMASFCLSSQRMWKRGICYSNNLFGWFQIE